MDTWGRPATVSYKRWRNPSSSDDFAGHGDEVQGTDYEICTISTDQFNNPSGGGAPSSPGPKKKEVTFTVDEAVEAVGFGKFQFKISLLTGLSWVADAMEMMILSILGPQLHCEWRLPGYQVALITSVVFLGMAISSYVWGRLSDKYGRKTGLMLCMMWTLYYSLLCAFAPVYIWLLILRGLVGFGIGGAAQSVTLYSEFLPKKSRGISVMMMTAFWAIGTVAEVLLALLVMPTLGWRWLLGLSAVPMAIFVCFSIWLPESPRFDILMGRREKATATLERIAKENGKAMPRGKMVAYKQTSRGRLRHLLAPQYRRTTLLLWFIWFSFAFSYYGVVLLTTELFQSGDSCGVAQVAKNEPACSLECKYLTTADYKDLLWTTLAEFPGLLVILGAIDCIGRKKSMALCFFMFTLSILPLYACIGRIALTIFIFIARAFISGGYQVAFVYTPEVFPTEIRALAMGTSSGVARLGALITPFVAQVLLRSSVYLTMSVYCGCSLLAGVASLLLPIETLGRSMQESDQDQSQNQEQDRDQGASGQT